MTNRFLTKKQMITYSRSLRVISDKHLHDWRDHIMFKGFRSNMFDYSNVCSISTVIFKRLYI